MYSIGRDVRRHRRDPGSGRLLSLIGPRAAAEIATLTPRFRSSPTETITVAGIEALAGRHPRTGSTSSAAAADREPACSPP